MPGIEVDQWHAVIGPAGIPGPIVGRLSAEIRRTLEQPEVKSVLLASGGAVIVGSLILYAIDPGNIERPSQSRAGLSVSPGGVKVVIRW